MKSALITTLLTVALTIMLLDTSGINGLYFLIFILPLVAVHVFVKLFVWGILLNKLVSEINLMKKLFSVISLTFFMVFTFLYFISVVFLEDFIETEVLFTSEFFLSLFVTAVCYGTSFWLDRRFKLKI